MSYSRCGIEGVAVSEAWGGGNAGKWRLRKRALLGLFGATLWAKLISFCGAGRPDLPTALRPAPSLQPVLTALFISAKTGRVLERRWQVRFSPATGGETEIAGRVF